MVGPANLSTLPEEHTPTVRVESELIKPAGDSVCLDPYDRDGSRVKDVGRGHQHPKRGMGGEENTMIAI